MWHPQQVAQDLPDGGLQLIIPYADERELLMDILRHGHHMKVLAPAALRTAVAAEARRMAQRHVAPAFCQTASISGEQSNGNDEG